MLLVQEPHESERTHVLAGGVLHQTGGQVGDQGRGPWPSQRGQRGSGVGRPFNYLGTMLVLCHMRCMDTKQSRGLAAVAADVLVAVQAGARTQSPQTGCLPHC